MESFNFDGSIRRSHSVSYRFPYLCSINHTVCAPNDAFQLSLKRTRKYEDWYGVLLRLDSILLSTFLPATLRYLYNRESILQATRATNENGAHCQFCLLSLRVEFAAHAQLLSVFYLL